ncbi:MAG: thymidylate synthase [Thermoprotei archaeon]|nr:MAG: thymidylate synthase [Thermoprotei archaeon]
MLFNVIKLKILTLSQGLFGNRTAETLAKKGPSNWKVKLAHVPQVDFEQALDEPETVHIEGLEGCDLVLSLCENPSAMLLLPTIAKRANASSVIVAIDRPRWSPGLGLEAQVKEELRREGIACVFARPFCTLEPIGDPYIDEFAKFFGKPELEIEIRDNVVVSATVKRSAPCGSTYYVAEKIVGIETKELIVKAGLLLHYYPCLASMEQDPILGDTPLHIAGLITKKAVYQALKRALQRRKKLN